MRPKRYPYSGQKKQSDSQIASIENDINILRSVIQMTQTDLNYRISKLFSDSNTE